MSRDVKFYVKVWFPNLKRYKYIDDLTLNEAQIQLIREKNKGRKAIIHKHKKGVLNGFGEGVQ